MKALLINPPSPFLINQKAFLPLGLLYLAAVLERNNIYVEVLDLANKETVLENVLEKYSNYDIYGITSSTPQYPYAKEIKSIIKKINSKAIVVIGGSHPSSVPQNCINDGFDIVVKGEGEEAILKIINEVEYLNLPTVIEVQYIKNIDTIPYPARHLININEYGYDIDTGRATTIITSRGCPFNCAFCSKDVWQNSVRLHSANYVINEVKEIINTYGITNFLFLDDLININRTRLLNICEGLKPLNIKWRCYARVNKTTDKDVLIKMREAGCVEIGLGIESGSQKILDIVNKKTTVKENTDFVLLCKEVGIKVNTFIMIGLPGETRKTVQETKEWIEKVKPDKFGFNIFMPYVGTPVYKSPDKYDIKIHPFDEKDTWVKGKQGEYNCFVETSSLSRNEILELFYELFNYYTELLKWQPGVGNKK